MRPYMFVSPNARGFKLVVFAASLRAARAYVKAQWASKAHRALKFAGQGEPALAERDCWVAAVASR